MAPIVAARLSGVIVLALGLVAAGLAHRLPTQSGFGLGPAFLPFWTGLVLAACGLWLCARPSADADSSRPSFRGLARAAVGFIALLFYTLALEPLGFLLSTAGFLAAGIFLLEPDRPVRALLLGFVSAGFLLLIFRLWLRVPLPAGALGW